MFNRGDYGTRVPRGLVLGILCSISVFAFGAVNAGPPAKIDWNDKELKLEVPIGGEASATITFTADRDAGPLDLHPVPSLAAYLQINPSRIDSVTAGEPVQISVRAVLDEDHSGSVRGGAIYVRDGNRTLAKPLNVKLLAVAPEGPPREEMPDDYVSPGRLKPVSVSESSFNRLNESVVFEVQGVQLDARPGQLSVFHNGRLVDSNLIEISDSRVEIDSLLDAGPNAVEVIAHDQDGRFIDTRFDFWAGSHQLIGVVIDGNGDPLSGAEVKIRLTSAPGVTEYAESDSEGIFVFDSLPPYALDIEGRSGSELFGTVAASGNDGNVLLILRDIRSPSDVDNNDFSKGLDGWEVGSSPVFLIPSDQELFSVDSVQIQNIEQGLSREERYLKLFSDMEAYWSKGHASIQSGSDLDLVLATAGVGPQYISRTFQTDDRTRAVTVRYQFVTTEVPGGYCGTRFDDSFGVNIRAQNAGSVISETASMNSLGCGAFDGSGRTSWRERTLVLDDSSTDVVQIDLMVANVGDALYDSYLRVALVKEEEVAITGLRLGDIAETDPLYSARYSELETRLSYLSLSPHPYFGGNTIVYGDLQLEGPEDEVVDSVYLDIIQGGVVRGEATLHPVAASNLLGVFGSDGVLAVEDTSALFQFDPSNIGGIALDQDGTVSLRVRVVTGSDEEVTEEAGIAEVLVRPADGLQYYLERNLREAYRGGTDWVVPSVAPLIGDMPEHYQWGQMSKMNGGPFGPHASHRNGKDIDAWFFGYNARDGGTAENLIQLLNSNPGQSVQLLGVTYELSEDDELYMAIRDTVLDDGRPATDVIRPWAGHTGHFHIRF